MIVTLAQVQYRWKKSPANQLVVNDPGVSSYHAEIHPQGSGYSIIALESTNGTYVNGYKLRPNIQSPLNPGDIIYIGRIVFYYMYKPNYAYAPQTKPYDVSPSISGRPKGCRLSVTIAGSIALVMLIVFTAYAYDTFVRIPSDQSMLLTTFCNALKSQQYMIAYDLLSSRNKRSISETQFAHEFGGNDDAFKITGCVIKSSPANNSSGTIALTFANGSTVNDTYTLVQENGIWKIDLKSP